MLTTRTDLPAKTPSNTSFIPVLAAMGWKNYTREGDMVVNILGWLVIVALAVLFGWLAVRLWRVKNRFLKWAGVV